MLRRRITGVRGIDSMLLEIRKWNPLTAMWSTYYRGTIDDSTIVVHENYVEASTTPIGVAQDMIAKADEEVTVTMQGKRIVVPRMEPFAPFQVLPVDESGPQNSYGRNGPSNAGVAIPSNRYHNYIPLVNQNDIIWGAKFNPFDNSCIPKIKLTIKNHDIGTFFQPYFARSVDGLYIVAKSGTYKVTNNISLKLALYGRPLNNDLAGMAIAKTAYIGGVDLGVTPRDIASVPAEQTQVLIGSQQISGGNSSTVVLTKGEPIRVSVTNGKGGTVEIVGRYQPTSTPSVFDDDRRGYLYQFAFGSVDIEPIQVNPDISAPAVRDIDLFAQVCRQITNRKNLAFDFSRYTPSYLSTPNRSPAATFILSLSRLKESEVEDGVATLQGTNEAYFKGLTLNQFYKYFLAQGYKVAVLQVPDSDGVLSPRIIVAPYCNTDRKSFYFPPGPCTMVDLGSAVTSIEMARYEHTFLQVVVGTEPQDYGNFPREEGYQDPCNRRITYGIGIENPGDPYEIMMPWGITTFGLEEELLTFEGENDEARAKRWTDGTAMWIVCGEADSKGQIESITQYGPVAGLYYKPLNLGLRPESLVRRNIPLLCMSLASFDMENTFYIVENIEGDDISVESAAASTGDRWLHDYNTQDFIRDTDPQSDTPQSGIFRPVMLTLRSTTGENIYALLHEKNTRYGVVRFEYKNKEVVGYLRSAEINPTEQAVQKWEVLPIWTQDLTIFD